MIAEPPLAWGGPCRLRGPGFAVPRWRLPPRPALSVLRPSAARLRLPAARSSPQHLRSGHRGGPQRGPDPLRSRAGARGLRPSRWRFHQRVPEFDGRARRLLR